VTPNGLKSQPTTSAAHYVAADAQPGSGGSSEVIVRHPRVTNASAQLARAEVSIDLRRADVMTWRDKSQKRGPISSCCRPVIAAGS